MPEINSPGFRGALHHLSAVLIRFQNPSPPTNVERNPAPTRPAFLSAPALIHRLGLLNLLSFDDAPDPLGVLMLVLRNTSLCAASGAALLRSCEAGFAPSAELRIAGADLDPAHANLNLLQEV